MSGVMASTVLDTVHSHRAHAIGHGQQSTATGELNAKKDSYQCSHVHACLDLVFYLNMMAGHTLFTTIQFLAVLGAPIAL
jgi:hypothetical protein